MLVEFDRHSFKVDGRRIIVRAGALHYFRLPSPTLWRDRIQKIADAGLNAVDVRYAWNYHSPAKGEFDFDDLRNVDTLHDLVEEAGLYLIARPGPYIRAELDFGGLPAWLLQRNVIPRCRVGADFSYSREYMESALEWFAAIVPRFAGRANLLAVGVESGYAVPAPLAQVSPDLWELALHWLGPRRIDWLMDSGWFTRREGGHRALRAERARRRGQTSPYMRELIGALREHGVGVPLFHDDASPVGNRQMDVDILGLDRSPITRFFRDWREGADPFAAFAGDEGALETYRTTSPASYPGLQAGWFDGWGGVGYEALRENLGADSIDATAKAALAERATFWSYAVFCGGTTWGYLGSPDVYTSYDFAAPVSEGGSLDARYEVVRELNAFIARHEASLAATERVEGAQTVVARESERHRFEFHRNPTSTAVDGLGPWETQIRVFERPGDTLVDTSPPLPARAAARAVVPPAVPRLERWRFSPVSPQIEAGYADDDWTAIPDEAMAKGRADIDALGLHYGFVWYRGTFRGALDRLILDARHCWSVWINGAHVASADNFRNTSGVGPDASRTRRIDLRRVAWIADAPNAVVVLVESLGHNKGLCDDGTLPRGLVRVDVGSTPVRWRFRGGLVRGERGIAPVVAFDGVERLKTSEVVLPHGWTGAPEGVVLYETTFRLDGNGAANQALGLGFDPGKGKANLYLNGYLIGRYWPERGPQRTFHLPWGMLDPSDENHLAVALWKRGTRASLGKLRFQLM